jgi:hypothetical protein
MMAGFEQVFMRKALFSDRALASLALPAHLLVTAALDVRKQGWQLRPDVFMHLDRAAAAALTDASDTMQVARVAQIVDDTAARLLRDLHANDPRDAMLAVAFFILKLVEEGLLPDAENQAVLVSLHLMADARDAGSDWHPDEAWLTSAASSMLRRANLLGYFWKLPKKSLVLQPE